MSRVRAQVHASLERTRSDRAAAATALRGALDDADLAFADALALEPPDADATAAALLALAARVLVAAAELADGASEATAALASELQAHEHAVLVGEATYRLDAEE